MVLDIFGWNFFTRSKPENIENFSVQIVRRHSKKKRQNVRATFAGLARDLISGRLIQRELDAPKYRRGPETGMTHFAAVPEVSE